jgi:ComF family protein
MRLLARFLDIIIPPRPTELLLRTLTDDGLVPFLHSRAITPPGLSTPASITALSLYSEPHLRAAIMETKFHGNRRAARMLGILTAAYISRVEGESFLILPIPLSERRRKERGHNQVERIASHVARLMSGKVALRTDILFRTRDTAKQTSLNRRDRLRNLSGAFEVRVPIEPNRTYIVLDDVTTTGATLAAAIVALRAAGACSIMPIAVAYQPIGNER